VPVVETHRATPERWSDIAALFERPGPRGGTPIPSQCWCQYWHTRGREYWEGAGARNRARLEQQLRRGLAPALIAYAGSEAVGWCRLGPRDSFERLAHSKKLAPLDDEPVWSVVCFYVHPAAKRQGVASALLEAAVELAAEHGARILEGYAARQHHPNVDSYTGYLPMFLAAGFEEVAEGGRRAIVRRRVR
jgi:GNAT superfamily N-acetyltransferase